tara:strand:+ start:366 stop:566 length:201 start_codon:yes stop_codon:yes gene_type:complete
MKNLKDIRDVLGAIWIISIVARIISKVTDIYEMPQWSEYVIAGIIFLVISLSLYIHLKEKHQRNTR